MYLTVNTYAHICPTVPGLENKNILLDTPRVAYNLSCVSFREGCMHNSARVNIYHNIGEHLLNF